VNRFHEELMGAPSITGPYCALCGDTPTTLHHLVPRSQGGVDGPVISLCGHGTAGHHGAAEDKRLHFYWDGKNLFYLETHRPTKYDRALYIGGWIQVGRAHFSACLPAAPPVQCQYLVIIPPDRVGD